MHSTIQSPWIAITTGIAGLVAGYSLVVAQHGAAFAIAPKCGLNNTVCTRGDCAKDPSCTSGTCAGNCPGCANQPT